MPDYDFIVVGSGFGGSVSALRLAEKGYRVAVLEQGKRWLPEDFPRSNWNARKYLWMPRLACYGIQRLTLLRDALVLSGTGVGGGSLVYAAVLLEPPPEAFDDPKWKDLCNWREALRPHYATARRMLGVTPNPSLGRADEALREISAGDFRPTEVAIFFGSPPGETVPDPFFGGEGPPRTGCDHCGGCMIGCRHGAKNSLDRNYLWLAERRGARIVPETRVTRIEALPGGGYRVSAERSTGFLHPRRAFTASGVVVSAGVLGTVPLLLRSKQEGGLPRLSDELGKYVRTNSEVIVGAAGCDPQTDFSRGIAITSAARLDEKTQVEVVRYPRGSDFMSLLSTGLSDGGRFRRLRWLRDRLLHPLRTLRSLVPLGWARRTVILLVMQNVDNRMRLLLGRRRRLQVLREGPPVPAWLPQANRAARALAEKLGGQPQSAINEVLFGAPVTAHILGGAAMGKDAGSGVVDAKCEAFGHPNLFVVDGSMIGANLGVNPSLTITALAEHAMSFVPPCQNGSREARA